MKAITASGIGGPEVLRWSDAPSPVVGPGEVVIDIAATAVNRADIGQRQGKVPAPRGGTDILGLECSGTIAAVAPDVPHLDVGARVCALLDGGGYAEKVAVPAGQVMALPDSIDLVEAAAIPEVACTVYSNLVMDAGLHPGETVLIHGGGSGIGTFGIQLVRARGAIPIVTVGSTGKAEKCLELGAALAINYREEDFVEKALEVTSGQGIDVILDSIGGEYVRRGIDALALDGRLLLISARGGAEAHVDLRKMLQRRATVRGALLRDRDRRSKARIVARVQSDVLPLVEAKTMRPVIHAVESIEDVGTAHRQMENDENFGKIVLVVDPALAR